MSDQLLTHITAAGERWDLVAWKYYGDPTLYGPIVMANPDISIEPVFEVGLTIMIPVLQKSNATSVSLPPWKNNS